MVLDDPGCRDPRVVPKGPQSAPLVAAIDGRRATSRQWARGSRRQHNIIARARGSRPQGVSGARVEKPSVGCCFATSCAVRGVGRAPNFASNKPRLVDSAVVVGSVDVLNVTAVVGQGVEQTAVPHGPYKPAGSLGPVHRCAPIEGTVQEGGLVQERSSDS